MSKSVKGFGDTTSHPILIKDDFLGESYSDRLLNVALSPLFRWKFEPFDVTYGSALPESRKQYSNSGWVHHLLQEEEYSEFLNLYVPLLDNIQDFLGTKCSFNRLRVAMHQNTMGSPKHNNPHTDYEDDHYVAIYYLNDSDGDTVLFKEYDDPHSGSVKQRWENSISINNFTIDKTVTPKKNRLMIFDGHQFHASSHPKESNYRLILNVNFTTETPIF
jgi:hypothetical protein